MNFSTHDKSGVSEGFCLIKSMDKKITAKGVPYLDLVFADSSGEMGAKLWDFKQELHGWIQPDMLVKVRGTVSPFNDVDQMRVERIRPVCDTDNVKIEDYIPSSAYSGEKMLGAILETVNAFSDEELKKLVLTCIDEKRERLLFWPAAFKLHHAIRGGLLVHTLSVLRLAQSVAEIYPFVNKDLLFAGAILHDIAKTDEYEASSTGIATGYTVDGNLVGHCVRGAMLVERVGESISTPPETLRLVVHMLISHHGEPEFGAAVRPLFLEAEILSQLDLLDARVYEIAAALESVSVGEFSTRQWSLDNRKFFNHGKTSGGTAAELF